MPKAVRIPAPVNGAIVAFAKSDNSQLVSIALFSGIGLLVSLIAVLLGVQAVWQ